MKKIKFSIRVCIITIGLLLFTQLPVSATTGKATTSSLRIRKTASTESEVLEVLAIGDKVEILGEEGDWYKISAKGYTGYVSKSYINVNENTENINNQNTEQNVPNQSTETNESTESNETDNNGDNTENNNDGGNSNNNENNVTNNEQNNNQQTPDNSSENTDNNIQAGDNQSNTQDVAPENNATNKVYKIVENTQIYILPVLTSETIGDVAKDANVTLINNAGLWGYVQTDSVKGWVRIDKLSSENVNVQTQDVSSNEQNNNNQNVNEQNDKTDDNNEQNNNSDGTVQNNDNQNNNSETNNAQDNQQNDNSQTNNTQNNSTVVEYQPKTMYIKSTAVNVRNQPNTNSDIVTGLGLNTQVKVVGEENGWYKVEINGKSGYIRKDLLSDSKTETSSRSEDINRTKQSEQTQAQTAQNTSAQNEQTTTKVTTTTPNNQSTTTTATTTSSGVTGDDIVAYAKQFVGYPYVYGAAGPNSFDCSGLTMYVYKHFGYSLSHSSKVQATQGVAVTGDLQAGDILVFKNGSSIGHVGIYIGNDKFIHASDSTTGVIISNLSDKWNISKYVGARRILK